MRLAGYVELVFPPGTCSLNSSALLERIQGLGADAGGYVYEAGGRRVVAYRPLYNNVLTLHDGLVYVVEVGDASLNGSTHGFIGVYTLCCGRIAWAQGRAGGVAVEEDLIRDAARRQGWLLDRVEYPSGISLCHTSSISSRIVTQRTTIIGNHTATVSTVVSQIAISCGPTGRHLVAHLGYSDPRRTVQVEALLSSYASQNENSTRITFRIRGSSPEDISRGEEAAKRLLRALGIPMPLGWREEPAGPPPHDILVHRSFEALVRELDYLNATGILKCGGGGLEAINRTIERLYGEVGEPFINLTILYGEERPAMLSRMAGVDPASLASTIQAYPLDPAYLGRPDAAAGRHTATAARSPATTTPENTGQISLKQLIPILALVAVLSASSTYLLVKHRAARQK